ncbi:MAG: hypothetical protein ABI759_24690 [Candidatus Solibacter sp.]
MTLYRLNVTFLAALRLGEIEGFFTPSSVNAKKTKTGETKFRLRVRVFFAALRLGEIAGFFTPSSPSRQEDQARRPR